MSNLLAIDPGNLESGWALLDVSTRAPIAFGKATNAQVRETLQDALTAPDGVAVAIELIGHYGTGMPAGTSVFDTCREIGRVEQLCQQHGTTPYLVKRATVKAALCGTGTAKDGHVAQALADRFAPGSPNRGKGAKDKPGWFYGFAKDAWQAYALGVVVADYLEVPHRYLLGMNQAGVLGVQQPLRRRD